MLSTRSGFLPILLILFGTHMVPTVCSGSILYGITGDGAKVPETLFELNQTDASKKFVLQLGRGGDGEAIAFNPNDGCLYHASGATDVIFERISPSGTITDIPLSNMPMLEVGSITWNPTTESFYWGAYSAGILTVSPDGVATKLGNGATFWKGLAFVGSTLEGVTSRSDEVFRIDPSTGNPVDRTKMQFAGYTITDGNGLAVDPDTGVLWALLNVGPDGSRHLAKIDLSTGTATDVGNLGDKFAGIAFASHPVPEPTASAMFWAASMMFVGIRWRR